MIVANLKARALEHAIAHKGKQNGSNIKENMDEGEGTNVQGKGEQNKIRAKKTTTRRARRGKRVDF